MTARGQRGAFDRTPLRPDRVRRIDGSFAHLPHRFLREGFWATLTHEEMLAYVLLVLVADRQGMSFYRDDRLAAILRLVLDDFLAARAGLLVGDRIVAVNGMSIDGYTSLVQAYIGVRSSPSVRAVELVVERNQKQVALTYRVR